MNGNLDAVANLFAFSSENEWRKLAERLTDRQQRLAIAAITYHGLINPERELQFRFYLGEKNQYPRLTDGSSLDGALAADADFLGEVRARGTAPHTTAFPSHYRFGTTLAPDPNQRYILLTPDDSSDADVRSTWQRGLPQKVYDQLELRSPAVLDVIREATTRWRERHLADRISARRVLSPAQQAAEEGIRGLVQKIVPGASASGAQPAVIVGMHWLQTGGAERWAVETVAMVRDAGLVPIIITDHESQNPWINRPELDGAVVLPLTFPVQQRLGDEPLLRALVEAFDIRGVLVHHCQWLYDRLPWLKENRPKAEVIDFLHVIEYNGGGFPNAAVHEDAFIDEHMVISPQLQTWLVETQGVNAQKVVLAPLSDLTVHASQAFRPRSADTRFTVGFIGRMARQKRPDAFLLTAQKLQAANPGAYRFLLHGDGELDDTVDGLIRRLGLSEALEWRRSDLPVDATLAECDLLMITSRNEGITLTSLEAVAAGVPVISTAVGSQDTVVPHGALLPRATPAMISRAVHLITRLSSDDALRERLWEQEKALVNRFTERPSATTWTKDRVNSWM